VHIQASWQGRTAGGPSLTFVQIEVRHIGNFLYSAQLQNVGHGLGIAFAGIARNNNSSSNKNLICLGLVASLSYNFQPRAGQKHLRLTILHAILSQSSLIA